MIINHNMQSMNTNRVLSNTRGAQAKSMEKLSSGLRINRAGDDAAGLSISEKMRGQIRGLNQASRNAQDGISMIQTAEGALNETENILQRMRELSVQAANDTNVTADRNAIQAELSELSSEIDNIANTTEFNGKKLIDGSLSASSSSIKLQIGANGSSITVGSGASAKSVAAGQMEITIGKMSASTLNVNFGTTVGAVNGADGAAASISVGSAANARTAVENIDSAIETVSKQRSLLGAKQNRLEHTINNLDNTQENLQAAESRIRDVDMAKEMTSFTKTNVLQQAAQSMLAQANQAPQSVLSLLG